MKIHPKTPFVLLNSIFLDTKGVLSMQTSFLQKKKTPVHNWKIYSFRIPLMLYFYGGNDTHKSTIYEVILVYITLITCLAWIKIRTFLYTRNIREKCSTFTTPSESISPFKTLKFPKIPSFRPPSLLRNISFNDVNCQHKSCTFEKTLIYSAIVVDIRKLIFASSDAPVRHLNPIWFR